MHWLYTKWTCMLGRCENPQNPTFKRYGGRGIKVCSSWHNFRNFINDMGIPSTRAMQIDRKNNNGNYQPDNCRWATRKEQARNRRDNHFLEFRGNRATIAEWSEVTGIRYDNIKNRINNLGWSVQRALTTL